MGGVPGRVFRARSLASQPAIPAAPVDRHGADPVERTTGCVRQLWSGLRRVTYLPVTTPNTRRRGNHGWLDVGDAPDSDGLGEMADGDALGEGVVVGVDEWLACGI